LDVDVGDDVASYDQEVVFDDSHLANVSQSITYTTSIRSYCYDFYFHFISLTFDVFVDFRSRLRGSNYDVFNLVADQELDYVVYAWNITNRH